MSIAGMDPSAGAGLPADIKTFEQLRVYGLAVSTAQTLQTEDSFYGIRWETPEAILEATGLLLRHYAVQAVKIGIVENVDVLYRILCCIRDQAPGIPVVLDPVLRSSTGFPFFRTDADPALARQVLDLLSLITPNYPEIGQLLPGLEARTAAQKLSARCPVLLKGGHHPDEPGVDHLFAGGHTWRLPPGTGTVSPKHGSGCVLSSAIAAGLAQGLDLYEACVRAKSYTEQFLSRTQTLLGYHAA